MKKGKIFTKRHIVTASLVVCLAAAVWLNMRYSSFETGDTTNNFNENQYYNTNSSLGEAVETAGNVSQISTARTERNNLRTKTLSELKTILENSNATDEAKSEALKGLQKIADNISNESSIETIIKAKGFKDALAVISDETVTVVVPKDELLSSETLQIQDAVTSQIKIDLEKIKIIAVK